MHVARCYASVHLFYLVSIADVEVMVALSAGAQQSIHAIFTPTALGKAEVLIACCTDSMSPPAGFSAVSHVKGLSVAYTVQPYPAAYPLPPQSTLPSLSAHLTGDASDQAAVLNTDGMVGSPINDSSVKPVNSTPQEAGSLRAEFGDISIGGTKSLLLSISNESPIAASVNLWLDTFQADLSAATPATPLTQPYTLASSGSLRMPGSPARQRLHLTGLGSAAGMSGGWAQTPTPSLPLGSTAGAGVQLKGHKHHARRAGSQGHDSRQTLVSPFKLVKTLSAKEHCEVYALGVIAAFLYREQLGVDGKPYAAQIGRSCAPCILCMCMPSSQYYAV